MAALPRTVIPRIATHSLTWLVLVVYTASATLCRHGVEFGIRDLTSFDGSNTLITFVLPALSPVPSRAHPPPTHPPPIRPRVTP